MTTTTNGLVAKLLARAEEYERRAAGLRVAAEEFTGEQRVAKRNGMHRQLQAARELRVEQKEQKDQAADGAPAIAGILERTERAKRATRTKRPIRGSRTRYPDRARIVAEILREAGVALTAKELGAATRERGIRSLTGVHLYAKQGWIKVERKNGKPRYKFVRMPEADAAATTAE